MRVFARKMLKKKAIGSFCASRVVQNVLVLGSCLPTGSTQSTTGAIILSRTTVVTNTLPFVYKSVIHMYMAQWQ